jgi:hypothetical protein
MDSLLSFPVGLFHPLQHAGLARRTRDTDLNEAAGAADAAREVNRDVIA